MLILLHCKTLASMEFLHLHMYIELQMTGNHFKEDVAMSREINICRIYVLDNSFIASYKAYWQCLPWELIYAYRNTGKHNQKCNTQVATRDHNMDLKLFVWGNAQNQNGARMLRTKTLSCWKEKRRFRTLWNQTSIIPEEAPNWERTFLFRRIGETIEAFSQH